MVISDLYRFWFDIPGKGITQVRPKNSQLKWVDKKKQGYRFYQRTLESRLVLMDDPENDIYDFTLLMDLERMGRTCERVDVIIDKWCDCDNTWYEGFYTGYLRLNAGEWDVTNCTTTIPVVVQDKFTCLTTSWQNEVNMFDYGDDVVEVTPYIGVIQYQDCNDTIIFNYSLNNQSYEQVRQQITTYFWNHIQDQCVFENQGWTFIKHTFKAKYEVIQEVGDFDPSLKVTVMIRTGWAREFVANDILDPPPGNLWVPVIGGGWARQVNVTQLPILDETTTEGREAIAEEWNVGTDDFAIGILSKLVILGLDAHGNSILTNGKELGPVLRDLLAPCGLTVVSNFLNINPDGTAPDNIHYENAVEDFHGIVLYQVTDLARLDETEAATIALIKLKELLDALKVAGNLDVDIEGSTLRIEHLSYWPDTVQMDLTLPEFYHLIKEAWKYTYDTEAQPKIEIIAWGIETDMRGHDFDGYPIEYDNACVNDQDEKIDKTYTATNYVSNVIYVVGNEDFFDDTQTIVMVSTQNLVIQSPVQPISGLTKLNGNLAMGYLIPRYYTYGRPFKEGTINKILTPFYLLQRLRLQAPITIPMTCDDYLNEYTPSGLIKTQLGGCAIETATYTDPEQQMEFKLRAK